MGYSSATIPVPGLTWLMFAAAYLAGFLPVFTAWKLKRKGLMIVSVLCGFLSFICIPPVISTILVARSMPQRLNIPKKLRYAEAVIWITLLAIGMLLPAMGSYGASINSWQMLGLMVSTSSYYGEMILLALPMILFLIAMVTMAIGCFVAKDNTIYGMFVVLLIFGGIGLGWFIYYPAALSMLTNLIQIGPWLMVIAVIAHAICAWPLTHHLNISGDDPAFPHISIDMSSAKTVLNKGKWVAMHARDIASKAIDETAKTHQKESTCTKCGRAITDKVSFCPYCGAEIHRLSACPVCNKPIKPGQRFCGGCGQKLI